MKRLICFILASLIAFACAALSASAELTIAIDDAPYAVYVGKPQKMAVLAANDPDAALLKRSGLVWASSDPNIASVNAGGAVTGKKSGTVTITASSRTDPAVFAAVVEVRVPVQQVTVSEKSVSVLVGAGESAATARLTYAVKPADAYFQTGRWTSSRPDVASVDENGEVTGHKAGTAVVTFTSDDPNSAKTARVNVKVSQAVTSVAFDAGSFTLPVGKSRQVKATAAPANAANKKLEWSSSDTSVATVTAAGQVKAVRAGTAVITAKAKDGSGAQAQCLVTAVLPVKKLAVQDRKIDLAPGTQWAQSFTVEPEDATDRSVVWSSSNEKVATVDENGVITGVAPGTCSVTGTAADGSGAKARADVKVQDYEIVITSPEGVQVSFATVTSESSSGVEINHRYWGDFYKTAVAFKTGCAAGGPDNTLLPVRAGADTVTITETHNGKRVSSAAHTVYVAQSALAQPEEAGEEG